MTSPADNNPDRQSLGGGYFVMAGLSFIPLIGVLFGIISILFGLLTKRQGGQKLAVIGAGGILFTIIIYGSLFYFGLYQRGGIFDELRSKLAQSQINSLVAQIELYKVQNGKYPESLKALEESLHSSDPRAALAVYDPSQVHLNTGKIPYFYYEVADADHYYLLGVGADGTPFTADDILPRVPVAGHIGLLTDGNRRSRP
jgi:hypothetical protein